MKQKQKHFRKPHQPKVNQISEYVLTLHKISVLSLRNRDAATALGDEVSNLSFQAAFIHATATKEFYTFRYISVTPTTPHTTV